MSSALVVGTTKHAAQTFARNDQAICRYAKIIVRNDRAIGGSADTIARNDNVICRIATATHRSAWPSARSTDVIRRSAEVIHRSAGHFPTDEAATKLLYLALRNIMARWQKANKEWGIALPHFAILFGTRFTHVTE